jgi:hypothetical protein
MNELAERGVEGIDAIYRYWYRVLAVYSCRDLSYDSNKITGISGIADLMARNVQDRLVHGLWMKDIARGLLWSLRVDTQTRRTTLRAPPWSWASCHGGIFDDSQTSSFNFGARARNSPFLCINYRFRLPYDNDAKVDTRRAHEGVLRITGLCRRAKLHIGKESQRKVSLSFDESTEPTLLQYAQLDGTIRFPEGQAQSSPSPFMCLQIGIWGEYPVYDYREGSVQVVVGLVSTRETETTFCRVGVFWLFLYTDQDRTQELLNDGWTCREIDLVWITYDRTKLLQQHRGVKSNCSRHVAPTRQPILSHPRVLLNQIRPLLRNRIRSTHNVSTNMAGKNTRVYDPQSLNTLNPQPLIHNLAHTRRPNQVILRRDMLSKNLNSIIFCLQTNIRSRLDPLPQRF